MKNLLWLLAVLGLLSTGTMAQNGPKPGGDPGWFVRARRAASDRAAEKCAQQHPKWGKSVCYRLGSGEIWAGMSAEMLLEARGVPDRRVKNTTARGSIQIWTYEASTGITRVYIGPGLHVFQIEE